MSTMGLNAAAASALRPVAALALALFGIVASMPASAQARPSGWQFELTNYLWATGLSGEVQSGNLPSSKVDMSFSDIFDNLDFAWSGAFEARKGRWGVLTDLQYYKLSAGGTASRTGPLGNTLTSSVDVGVKQTVLGVAGGYRVVEGNVPVDLVGGLRYTKLDVEMTSNFAALGLSGGNSRSGSKSWYDPYIGVRASYPLSDRWSVNGYADVGGFGAGSDSTWQVLAGMQYRYSEKYSLKFGYRVLDVDYDKDGFKYDMKSDGLFVGLGVRF